MTLPKTLYKLEVYDPNTRRYEWMTDSRNLDRLVELACKPYYRVLTRRIVRITHEPIWKLRSGE